MERIVVNSALNGFMLLDEITKAGAESMTARKTFVNAPAYLGVEALAQLGALHVRFLSAFEKHACLLAIKRCTMTSNAFLNGSFRFHGALSGRSSSAFSYALQAVEESSARTETVRIEGEFLFAAIDYDDVFRKDILQAHYQRMFSCLRNGSKTGC
jgi:hypothetical protein